MSLNLVIQKDHGYYLLGRQGCDSDVLIDILKQDSTINVQRYYETLQK